MSLDIKDFLGQYVKPNALKLGGEVAITEITSGGGGSQNLEDVLSVDNTTNGYDISISNGDAIVLDNNSKLKKGTIDAGLGGQNGISQICSIDYELKWEAGRLYVMNGGGQTIRQSLYNFNTPPTNNDDDSKGYLIGSIWSTDDTTHYVCVDNITGSANWIVLGFENSLEQIPDWPGRTSIISATGGDRTSIEKNNGNLYLYSTGLNIGLKPVSGGSVDYTNNLLIGGQQIAAVSTGQIDLSVQSNDGILTLRAGSSASNSGIKLISNSAGVGELKVIFADINGGPGLPTGTASLLPNQLWNDNGTLKIWS